jgi:XapX domain-containing protein
MKRVVSEGRFSKKGGKMKIAAGIILAVVIGAVCRVFDVPVPSPPKLVGALLVVAMTLGYLATDKVMATKFAGRGPAMTNELSGGPSGTPAEDADRRTSAR